MHIRNVKTQEDIASSANCYPNYRRTAIKFLESVQFVSAYQFHETSFDIKINSQKGLVSCYYHRIKSLNYTDIYIYQRIQWLNDKNLIGCDIKLSIVPKLRTLSLFEQSAHPLLFLSEFFEATVCEIASCHSSSLHRASAEHRERKGQLKR